MSQRPYEDEAMFGLAGTFRLPAEQRAPRERAMVCRSRPGRRWFTAVRVAVGSVSETRQTTTTVTGSQSRLHSSISRGARPAPLYLVAANVSTAIPTATMNGVRMLSGFRVRPRGTATFDGFTLNKAISLVMSRLSNFARINRLMALSPSRIRPATDGRREEELENVHVLPLCSNRCSKCCAAWSWNAAARQSWRPRCERQYRSPAKEHPLVHTGSATTPWLPAPGAGVVGHLLTHYRTLIDASGCL
jgi:hypothetical protein